MGLFPQTMLKATIITPMEEFPKLIIQLAETEKFMPKETTIDEDLEDYYPTIKLDSIRRIESSFEDLLKTLPEPKESLAQKIARAYRKIPPLNPLFTDWENIEEIETQIIEEIEKTKNEIHELVMRIETIQIELETKNLVSKGFRLLEEEFPYQVNEKERAVVGILTTSKASDAEEFISDISKKEVIPLIQNKFLIFAQGKKGEITRLLKTLSTVRWMEHKQTGPIHFSKLEIEEEIEKGTKDLEKEIKKLDKDSKQYTLQNKERIMALRLSIESYKQLLRIYVTSKKTKRTVIFQGWIAQKDQNHIKDFISEFSETVFKTEEPEEDITNIPVKQAKNPIMRSFQSIVGLYGLPSSKEVDPTIFFVFTFSIFYGIMFGDAGHGLIFMLIGLLGMLAKGLKRNIRTMFILVFSLGLASFIWGAFIFGEFFGYGISHDIFHNWTDPKLFGLHYPILSPVDNLIEIFNLVLIIGAIQLTLGLTLRLINQIRHKEIEEIIKETGAQVFLYAGILYFLSSLNIIDFGIEIDAIVGIVALLIGVVLALFGQGIAALIIKDERKNFFKKLFGGIGMGVMNLLESFSSFISNTISYGRLLAMLVAHFVFLSVINTLADLSGFIVWQILILVIGNIFVLVLEGLLVFVQTLRLHFYEFFSKFYEGSGIPHKPIFIFNKTMDLSKDGK
ncbi:MAG: V-type ATP synthase subunit I [Candidatus Heimdallarchaeaceae archaeon]